MTDNEKMRFLQQLVNDKRLKLTDVRVGVAIVASAADAVPPNFDDLVQASGVDRRSVGLSVIKLDELGIVRREHAPPGAARNRYSFPGLAQEAAE